MISSIKGPPISGKKRGWSEGEKQSGFSPSVWGSPQSEAAGDPHTGSARVSARTPRDFNKSITRFRFGAGCFRLSKGLRFPERRGGGARGRNNQVSPSRCGEHHKAKRLVSHARGARGCPPGPLVISMKASPGSVSEPGDFIYQRTSDFRKEEGVERGGETIRFLPLGVGITTKRSGW